MIWKVKTRHISPVITGTPSDHGGQWFQLTGALLHKKNCSVLQYCLHNKRNYPTYFLKISFCRIIQFIVSMKYEEQKNAPRTMFKPTYCKYILAALNARCSLSEKLTQNVHMYLFWVSLTDFLHRLQLSYVNRK